MSNPGLWNPGWFLRCCGEDCPNPEPVGKGGEIVMDGFRTRSEATEWGWSKGWSVTSRSVLCPGCVAAREVGRAHD